MSPYLLSLLVRVASFTTDLWGIKYKHRASLLARGLKKKKNESRNHQISIAGHPNGFHFSHYHSKECGSAQMSLLT